MTLTVFVMRNNPVRGCNNEKDFVRVLILNKENRPIAGYSGYYHEDKVEADIEDFAETYFLNNKPPFWLK